ncbi:MAG: hypothetical protein K6G16_09280 [Lachnospiraceae bacterium]|nr:hypothetical protein [Lachnospiraceae bacterium]
MTEEEQSAAFQQTLSTYYDELKWLYNELYHNDEQAFSYFISMLRVCYMRRDPSFVGRDRTDATDQTEISMLMYMDFDIQNMQKVGPQLDEARACGIGSVYLLSAKGDPTAFIRACHERDMRVGVAFSVAPADYRNPTLFNDMLADILRLCGCGADLLHCRPLPPFHPLVRMMRMALEIVCPGVVLVGETEGGLPETMSWFGTADKPECHVISNIALMEDIWHTVATRDVRLLRQQIELVSQQATRGCLLNFLRNHRVIRWSLDYDHLRQFSVQEDAHRRFLNDYFSGAWPGSTARGRLVELPGGGAGIMGTTSDLCGITAAEEAGDVQALDSAIRLDIMLHAIIFTLGGVPALCSDDYNRLNAGRIRQKGDWVERLFDTTRGLGEIRSSHRAFERGADVWTLETWNDHVLGIGRYCRGEKLLALFNFGDNDEIAWIDEAEPYTDLRTDAFREAKAVSLPAHDFAWLMTTF